MQHIADKVCRLLAIFAAAALCAGCSPSFVPAIPPIPDIAPFPSKVLSADEQRKAIAEIESRKQQQVTDAERQIKDGR